MGGCRQLGEVVGLESETYVRREHRGGDFAAVLAVADVRVDEAIAFYGLFCISACVRSIERRSLSRHDGILTTSSCTAPQ